MTTGPQADASDPAGPWTAGYVADRLRISTSTLRSWHRRYGIGPAGRQPGRYRRYSEADIAVLERMRNLIAAGVLAADAARLATGGQPGTASVAPRELVDAAARLDGGQVIELVQRSLADRGVVATWDELCRPALRAVAEQQTSTDRCIDVEHVLSWAILVSLHRTRPARSRAAPVLLACTEHEQHSLPLEALRAALTQHGVPTEMLGAATPPDALRSAVQRLAPAAAVLWAQRFDVAHVTMLDRLHTDGTSVLVAGPGWRADTLPPGVPCLGSLTHALEEISAVLAEAR